MGQQIKLTREDLYQKVWEKPTIKLAAEFGISDVALAKICRKMDVPKPPLGYWRRIETGSKITKTPLPKSTKKTREYIYMNVPAADGPGRVSDEIQAKVDQEDLPENQIKIADNLDDAHPLVIKTKLYYERNHSGSGVDLSLAKGKGLLNVSVTSEQITRALLIFDAIIKGCEKRGYEVTVSTNHWGEETRITKEGEELHISLYEHFSKVPRELTPEEKKKPPYLLNIPVEYEANGKLTAKINFRWSNYLKWSDRKKEPLENRLNDVMAGIVAMLEQLVEEKRKKEAEECRQQEALQKQEEEKQRREKLEADVSEWRKSVDISDYLDAYEARLIKEQGGIYSGSREAEWLAWARKYAAGLNPLNKIFSKKDE